MSISEFIEAFQAGKPNRHDKHVRELLFWIKALTQGKNLAELLPFKDLILIKKRMGRSFEIDLRFIFA